MKTSKNLSGLSLFIGISGFAVVVMVYSGIVVVGKLFYSEAYYPGKSSLD